MYCFYGCERKRILKKLMSNRSKNQKLIQRGEKGVTDMPKNRAFNVKIRRPVNQNRFLTFSDEHFVSTSSPYDQIFMVTDSSIDQDSSYASAAFMANDSFCTISSLGKLGSRSSYAKDTQEIISFLHHI